MHVRRTPTGRGRRPSGRGTSTARAACSPWPWSSPASWWPSACPVPPGSSRCGGAAAAVLGPLERLLGPGDDEVSAARAEQAALATRLAAAQREVAALHAVRRHPREPGPGRRPPRAGPGRRRRRVRPGRARARHDRRRLARRGRGRPHGRGRRRVWSGGSSRWRPWTSDVLLVGSPDLAVGVRVGPQGVLGEVSGAALAGGARPGARAALASPWSTGARRPPATSSPRWAASASGRTCPASAVGTVDTVHRAVGQVAPTGTVTPAVDTTTLDVVAVVLTAGRAHPAPGRDGHRVTRAGRGAAAGPVGPGGRAARRHPRRPPRRPSCPTSCSCWSSRWALLRGPVAGAAVGPRGRVAARRGAPRVDPPGRRRR